MNEPIVFISHHHVRDGMRESLSKALPGWARRIEREKPKTVLFAAYLDPEGDEVSFVHVFPDPDAFDEHLQGAAERATEARDHLQPRAFEIYGTPNPGALETMREATEGHVELKLWPDALGGYLHLDLPET